MKRFCLFFCLIAVFLFSGCSNFNSHFEKNISEIHTSLFSAEDKNFFTTLSLGKRENPYIVDGQSRELVEFAVLTVYPQEVKPQSNNVNYVLTTNAKKYNGNFEVNPFDNSFVVDLEHIETDFSDITVAFIVDQIEYTYKLENQLKTNYATCEEVKSIASKQFESIKDSLIEKNKMQAEVYIRVIKKFGHVPLWYVSVVSITNQLFALIIDPVSKEVIAKNFN